MCESVFMRTDVEIQLSPEDRVRLEKLVAARMTPQKHVWRAQIVLLSADGVGTVQIMRRTGRSKPTVWRWQARFAAEGVDGLLRDKTRPPGKKPLASSVIRQVVTKTTTEKPPAATHWTARAMAKAVGIAVSSVQKIWQAHGLKPHQVRTFKLSNDPAFEEKLVDIVGLYLDPPDKALVLSVDEKSQIQALDRTQPGLPLKKGRAGTMTHDYKRHGTTTLFAALNVLDGTVIGHCVKRHRHQEFIRFLSVIDERTPKDLDLHIIVDNYATHKHPEVKKWLALHPRFRLHFTPTSSSWLNLVERFFAEITRKRIRRGVFKSVTDLEIAIHYYLAEHNDHPKPFVWNAKAADILAKVRRGKQALESEH
jgi:transposase